MTHDLILVSLLKLGFWIRGVLRIQVALLILCVLLIQVALLIQVDLLIQVGMQM